MAENWFRGEGLSIKPAKAGGVDNDIGDGMYLTDKLDVAKQYAQERASSPDDRRVYMVKVDTTQIRVLDLTKDMRWKKHISFMKPPTDSSGKWSSIESELQAGNASQYSKHFKNFLDANKINLNDYDAVIGYEYRSGGKQMCILYNKNGQPSSVQVKLRASFIPIHAVATPKTPVGALRFTGKIGPGLKIAGGTFIVAIINLLLAWLLGKVIEKQQEEDFKKKLEALRPKIEVAIKGEKQTALKLLVDGKPAYATVRISVTNQEHYQGGGLGYMPTVPSVEYVDMEITSQEENKPDGEENERFLAPGAMLTRRFFKMSLQLTFALQEVELYRAYLKEIEWCESQIKIAPSIQDAQRLSQDRNNLVNQLYAALSD
ncbi:MAG: hypothetical protein H6973_14235 [Gammaproteobacteria bacterium]|nr:hypothetical protein [Gammaproteobacteria bacterium]HRX71599.1 hypothetical protein [Candidatus Competibacteraceae bacterium]